MIKEIKTNNSSSIKSIKYDETRKDLTVDFKSGRSYLYTPVSNEFFNKLNNSPSKGKFFYENIRNNEALTCMKIIN